MPACGALLFLFLLSLFGTSSTTPQCNEADKAALLSIKSAFTGTPNPLPSWTSNTTCCSWHGITCDSTTGRVRSLAIFQDDMLSGEIPPAIGHLSSLQSLALYNLPHLVGYIPESLANLTNLTLLDLSRNGLLGRIPNSLARLTSLTFLDLSNNRLSSPIPGSFSNLSKLTALHLENNLLYGNIPNTFGDFPGSSPPELYLSHNMLTGVISPSLGKPNWKIIDISRNRLMGDASILFGSNKTATQIDISRNRFRFDLSNVTFPLKLRALDLSHNMIYGKIPAQINEVTGLRKFNVSYNQLCGEIPAGSVTARFGKNAYGDHACLCGAPLSPCK